MIGKLLSLFRRGPKRSSRWSAVRAAHLREHPSCAACGTTKRLEVHHVIPFNLNRSLELEPSNLLTLCEGRGCNCHLTFGHLLNWKSWNPYVMCDAKAYRQRIQSRPNPEND